MRLRSERIVGVAGVFAGEVVVADGVIVGLVPGGSGSPTGGSGGSTGGELVELGDRWLVPGFIDTHVHGGGGAQFNTADPDEVAAVARFHVRHGTTALLATTVSAPVDSLVASVGAIRRAADAGLGAGARVLGAHLEGPCLSPAQPGAMDSGTFIEPASAVVRRLLGAEGGCVRMMTLAPELPGALELIGELVDGGVVASLGHSEASYEQACAAVAAGARSATHVFNAMPALHHRAPGLLGAVLDLPEVSCELICDGEHVSPPVMRLLVHAKGLDGVRLVTDAIEGAGMPDGEYRLGDRPVRVSGSRATVGTGSAGESLAGSMLTMDAAVAGAVRWLGLDVPEAVALASSCPARVLGLGDRLGAIAVGMDADLAVLDEELRACGTLVRGSWVCGPPVGLAA